MRQRHSLAKGGTRVDRRRPEGLPARAPSYLCFLPALLLATFPTCSARVGDALACDKWLTHAKAPPDGGTASAGSSPCAGLDRCLWLFRPESDKPGSVR